MTLVHEHLHIAFLNTLEKQDDFHSLKRIATAKNQRSTTTVLFIHNHLFNELIFDTSRLISFDDDEKIVVIVERFLIRLISKWLFASRILSSRKFVFDEKVSSSSSSSLIFSNFQTYFDKNEKEKNEEISSIVAVGLINRA